MNEENGRKREKEKVNFLLDLYSTTLSSLFISRWRRRQRSREWIKVLRLWRRKRRRSGAGNSGSRNIFPPYFIGDSSSSFLPSSFFVLRLDPSAPLLSLLLNANYPSQWPPHTKRTTTTGNGRPQGLLSLSPSVPLSHSAKFRIPLWNNKRISGSLSISPNWRFLASALPLSSPPFLPPITAD